MPNKPPSITDRAYLAGLIDGEGSICFKSRGKRRGGHSFTVTIYGTDPRLMEYLTTLWGGSVCIIDRGPQWKPQMAWTAKGSVSILRAALPFLILKAEQAHLLIKYADTALQSKKIGVPANVVSIRQGLVDEMQLLNKRGRLA